MKENPIDEISEKVAKIHAELVKELNSILFPDGRERAAEELEELIHRLTFGAGIDSELDWRSDAPSKNKTCQQPGD